MINLEKKIKKLNKLLESCTLCPHKCRVNRYAGSEGFCRSGKMPSISTHMIHNGEEPPISGLNGSGTIFFSNCNMSCTYCQNYQISQEARGNDVTIKKLSRYILDLQQKGVHNINLVSPTVWIPQIVEAISIARKSGLNIPIVYNTGGYDDPAIIKMLDGIVDIYMPDIRYSDDLMALKYSGVKKYVGFNRKSIIEMYRQVGNLKTDDSGIARRGLLIRILVLPNNIGGIKGTLDFIKSNLSSKIHLSIMAQYHPAYKAFDYPELSRRVDYREYLEIVNYARKLNLNSGWVQDHDGLESDKDEFIPDFNDKDVFKYYKD